MACFVFWLCLMNRAGLLLRYPAVGCPHDLYALNDIPEMVVFCRRWVLGGLGTCCWGASLPS